MGSFAAGLLYSAIYYALESYENQHVEQTKKHDKKTEKALVVRYPLLKTFSAMGGAILFAFSPRVWTYATGIEVFSLNNLFACWMLREFIIVLQSPYIPRARLLGCAFLCGLSLSNQHTIILFQIPIIVSLGFRFRNQIKLSDFLGWCGSFAGGLAPYAYLYWIQRISRKPGSWGNTASFSGLLHHILRRGMSSPLFLK